MKEIFIGSSSEALGHAVQVAADLSEVEGVKPLLWTECFKIGDLTFQSIENLARRVAGAVFLATPDDESVIRQERVRTPRANVMFEYGYLTAMLRRERVALCRYSGAELPSDFAGVTYVPMGVFDASKPIDDQARPKLRSWAQELGAVHEGFSPTSLMHGYSGPWKVETTYEMYRRIPIAAPDYVVLNGNLILSIPPDGNRGVGCLYGTLRAQIGACYMELEISDTVVDANVFGDGSLRLRKTIHTRQRLRLEGEPPQRDGFEPEWRGAHELDLVVRCPPDEPGILRGTFTSEVGGNLSSKATEKWSR